MPQEENEHKYVKSEDYAKAKGKKKKKSSFLVF